MKKKDIIIIVACVILGLVLFNQNKDDKNNGEGTNYHSNTLKILSSSENLELEEELSSYAKSQDIDLDIEFADTLEIMDKVNSGEEYDAIWSSNSIWLYLIDSKKATITNSKSTSINPVIFGIKKSKAEELGFVGKEITTNDIVEKIANKQLKFAMSNPTTTNSGASAYLGILSTLAGNPEVLTSDILNSSKLKEKLKTFFSGVERTSGNEDFLEELFLNGDYEAVVSYESSIININKKLSSQNKETLYAVYPVDGVSISDSVFAYIDNKKEEKKNSFNIIQSYILSDEGQKLLASHGRRTWYGGINTNADKTVFNPEWGIDTGKYITPIKYPNTSVIKEALSVYQLELRKPIHVVFCLDYSGSMSYSGFNELVSSMEFIFGEEAKTNLIQFSSKDKIDIIPFSTYASTVWSAYDGSKTDKLLNNIKSYVPEGSTALYIAAEHALDILKDEDKNIYNTSVILMTDGLSNRGTYSSFRTKYLSISKDIPVFSIMFGSADERELNNIAELTNGKVFDGKSDLVKAFKTVRGYN